MPEFMDKSVLVVGGSSGIGEAVAARCLAAGADVTIASRSREKIDAALASIGGGRGEILDTRDGAAVEALLSAREYDHIVVSAAQTRVKHIHEMPMEDALASFDSKFWGAYRVACSARIRPGGSLTIITGFRAQRAQKNNGLQGAINAALEGLVRGLALELAPVRVNAVSPGFTLTPLVGQLSEDQRREWLDKMGQILPVGRGGLPEHTAIQVTACMENPFMTGTTVLVEGGAALV